MTIKNNAGYFRAVVLAPEGMAPGNPSGFILVPKAVSDLLPRRGRTTVNAVINGHALRIRLEPDGGLSHWFWLDSPLIRSASIGIGAEVDVEIVPLPAEPRPEIPADFAKALAGNPGAMSVWDSTSAIAQVDWIHWIESGKQAKTRNERIGKACDMLESGKKRVCCFDPTGYYSKSLSAPKACTGIDFNPA